MEIENTPYIAIQVIVSTLGVVGNLVVISIILILREHQKSVTHWYVLNLASADTLFLLTLPLRAYEVSQRGDWILSEDLCKAKEVILFLNYYSSVLFLVIMSLDRYVAVCHTFSKPLQRLRTRFSAFAITFLVWVLSLILCIPVIMSVVKIRFSEFCKCEYDFHILTQEECKIKDRCDASKSVIKPSHCIPTNSTEYHVSFSSGEDGSAEHYVVENRNESIKEHEYQGEDEHHYFGSFEHDINTFIIHPNCEYFSEPLGFRIFLMFNFIAMFLVPLIIMILCYGLIVHRLSTSNLNNQQFTFRDASTKKRRKSSSSQSGNNRKRVTVMCATLVSSFIICWLPYHAVHLGKITGINGTDTSICIIMGRLGSILGFLNSALNPYLYSFMGTNFSRRWKTANKSVKKSVLGRQTSTTSLVSKASKKKRSRGSSASNPRPAFVKRPSN